MQRPARSAGRRLAIVLACAVALALVVTGGADLGVTVIRMAAALRNAAASTSEPDNAVGATTGGAIRWRACSGRELKRLHAQCGFLVVPLDWRSPGGASIRLAVSRVRHTSAERQGVIVLNPGGPGGSGLDTVDVSDDLPAPIAGRFDWVGFDPRGVGASEPSLACDPHYFDGPRPGYSPTAEHVAAWSEKAKAFAADCAANGTILRHMTTVDSAHDLDALRIALGQDRIDYYGFSYGTYLGQVYATLFPEHLGRMILDSTEDPATVDDQYSAGQAAAFEIAMRHWFAWVAEWDAVYHLGTTAGAVRHRFALVRRSLVAEPRGEVGADEWDDVFLDAAYAQSDWPDLAEIFVKAVRRATTKDLEDAYDSYGGSSDNAYAAYLAVQCTDGRIDRSVPHLVRTVTPEAERAPYAAWSSAWWGLPCAFWPAPAAARRFRVDGSGAPAALMIDETLDAATPYSGSLAVRALFPNARLVAEPGGTSHAETPDTEAPCVMRWIVRYLATGALPARVTGNRADATCAPPAEPTPN